GHLPLELLAAPGAVREERPRRAALAAGGSARPIRGLPRCEPRSVAGPSRPRRPAGAGRLGGDLLPVRRLPRGGPELALASARPGAPEALHLLGGRRGRASCAGDRSGR